MDGLQQLPSEHLAPQATSWVLNETRKKRQKLKGRVVFFFTNDSAVITPSGEAQLHPSWVTSSLLMGHDGLNGTPRTESCKDLDHRGLPKYPMTHRTTSSIVKLPALREVLSIPTWTRGYIIFGVFAPPLHGSRGGPEISQDHCFQKHCSHNLVGVWPPSWPTSCALTWWV